MLNDTIACSQVPCPLCHKLLKSHKSLKVHMRLHTGEARFRCDVCDKSFVQKESMLRHWRLHDPGHRAGNTCGTCGRTFSSQHHLKQHQLLHTQVGTRARAAVWWAVYDLTGRHAPKPQ